MSESVTPFELEKWEKESRQLITCTGCFGVGQRHFAKPHDRWELCPVCAGSGRSAADPEKLRLIAEVRRLNLLLTPQE